MLIQLKLLIMLDSYSNNVVIPVTIVTLAPSREDEQTSHVMYVVDRAMLIDKIT
jgi:hypothetical protein